MTYNLFPSVDSDFNLPKEVRRQLAKSDELKHLVIPMSQTTRDLLSDTELWVGRTIYNLTTKKLETFQDNDTWSAYLDETYEFPKPPPLWDENYDLPLPVSSRLAESVELRSLVVPMTEAERNLLSSADKWNGRTIYNITTQTLDIWVSAANSWVSCYNDNYNPVQPVWQNWTPELFFRNYFNTYTPQNYTASGRYIKDNDLLTGMFEINFTGDISGWGFFDWVLMSCPPVPIFETNIRQYGSIGTAMLDTTPFNSKKKMGIIERGFIPRQSNNYLSIIVIVNTLYTTMLSNREDGLSPITWIDGCSIFGQFSYAVE